MLSAHYRKTTHLDLECQQRAGIKTYLLLLLLLYCVNCICDSLRVNRLRDKPCLQNLLCVLFWLVVPVNCNKHIYTALVIIPITSITCQLSDCCNRLFSVPLYFLLHTHTQNGSMGSVPKH